MTSTSANTSSAAGKKDVQKLQRAIIDGLEDVKGVDIQVFDTEHITSLFERVIIASGSSNRQTKALAASVRDAVRDAGFAKPRIEGEENGEWIIVDCGAAVAHIMQPVIRQYYHLEELWGDKPVKIKLGAPAPLVKAAKVEEEAKPGKAAKARAGAKTFSKSKPIKSEKIDKADKPVAKKAAGTDDGTYVGRVGKTNDWTAKRNAMAPVADLTPKSIRATGKLVVKKAPAKAPVLKTPIIKIPATKKVVARKTAAKTAAKSAVKKPAAKKTTTRGK